MGRCFVGNDILSLEDKHNQHSFSNPKFLRKILTDKEWNFVFRENKPFLPFLFWTCKESAYKIALKAGLYGGFVPQYFEVTMEKNCTKNKFAGLVRFQDMVFYFRSEIADGYISTLASNNNHSWQFIQIYNGISQNSDPGSQMKKHLKQNISQNYNLSCSDFGIYKDEKGIPFLHGPIEHVMPDISFSHDDVYFSYAILYPQV
jgi:phosphopantetheinyl transferase (holo-ACP synthase)